MVKAVLGRSHLPDGPGSSTLSEYAHVLHCATVKQLLCPARTAPGPGAGGEGDREAPKLHTHETGRVFGNSYEENADQA